MIQPPTLPLPVRAMNVVGRGLRGLGIEAVSLDPEKLLERARRESGLSDHGDDGFIEGLERLCHSLESEAALTQLGRVIARTDIVQTLVNRLQTIQWRAAHPEVAEQAIARPLFIVGQARTGTTIMHELLALDPANRVPQTWEVDAPVPPPEIETYESDPRIAKSQAALDRAESLIPDFKRIHRMGATLPQECVRFMTHEMVSLICPATWRCPSYTRWVIEEADMSAVYAAHRRFLQHLQSRHAGERWVLKTPEHLYHLDALFGEYPDACVIQTHRDPLRVISSLTSLEVVLRKMASDDINAHEIAREWSEWNRIGYENATDFRTESGVADDQVIDIQFGTFMKDPVQSIARIYDHFGLELSATFESAMRGYLDGNPDDRDGRHRHAFSDTGLDVADERAKVERYQSTFGVESEPV